MKEHRLVPTSEFKQLLVYYNKRIFFNLKKEQNFHDVALILEMQKNLEVPEVRAALLT